jgi:hypothetical protein
MTILNKEGDEDAVNYPWNDDDQDKTFEPDDDRDYDSAPVLLMPPFSGDAFISLSD